jgi:thiol-disulfide isomerase/thioredoxin
MTPRRALGVAALALPVGCGSAVPSTQPTARQVYRASVTTPAGHEIPFFLELPSNCNTDRAAVVNGTERISVPCQRLGSHILLDFVVYGTRISAEEDRAGSFAGHWRHTDGGIGEDRLVFAARPVDRLEPGDRFAPPDGDRGTTSPAADVAGIWRIDFDSRGPGKAVFESADAGVVRGTAEVPSEYGDLRFLAGNVHGSTLSLSAFDGSSAYLIRGQLGADGRMRGEFINGSGRIDAFTAVRSEDFEVIDPLQRVRVTSSEKRLDFAPLLTPRYSGKAVIVELFGTWCSNCNDLAPLLVELYQEHRDDGLEILSVAYEISDNDAYRRERLAAYKAAHGVGWEVMIPSGPPDELLSAGPARLSSIGGVPVTIFFDRDRTIRAIYTGFWGPATGATHQSAAATFRRLTQEILATSAPAR